MKVILVFIFDLCSLWDVDEPLVENVLSFLSDLLSFLSDLIKDGRLVMIETLIDRKLFN